ncbi:MAG: hypothetical protein ACT4OJ_01790 [Bacteroidota bacterium]
MKKIFVLTGMAAAVLVLTNCDPTKKVAAAPVPKMTYETNLQTLIAGTCSPCHIPAKGGNKKAYDNYSNVKTDIDEIIRRIELNPGEKGFMPFKKTVKLSDSTINLFKQWRTDGVLEK